MTSNGAPSNSIQVNLKAGPPYMLTTGGAVSPRLPLRYRHFRLSMIFNGFLQRSLHMGGWPAAWSCGNRDGLGRKIQEPFLRQPLAESAADVKALHGDQGEQCALFQNHYPQHKEGVGHKEVTAHMEGQLNRYPAVLQHCA